MSAVERAKVLRLLTWKDFTPADVIAQFEKETGYKVQVTLASNDDMIARLRQTTGEGFDLAQPSQDRIATAQRDYKIYRPIDLARVKMDRFNPLLLDATRSVASVDGKLYGLPHIWGTDGLVVNSKLAARVTDYGDLCRPEFKGKTSVRLWRPTLLGFAFSTGKDPFAVSKDPKAYAALMDTVVKKLTDCKSVMKSHWDNKDAVLGAMRTGELVAAMVWDRGGWTLAGERAEFRYIAPRSGAMGWMDTFALPAVARNDEAAYAWINFNLRPDVAAKVVKSTGNLSAVKDAEGLADDKRPALYAASFAPAAIKQIRWYQPLAPGVEEIEGRALERIRSGP
ncbi:MAG: extracellular solute-binding protein [Aquabacterium sp.]